MYGKEFWALLNASMNHEKSMKLSAPKSSPSLRPILGALKIHVPPTPLIPP